MAHLFVEHSEYLQRSQLANGFVDFVVHQRWWRPWKPWTACASHWMPGASEPITYHKRAWTGRGARAYCYEMQDWIVGA